MSSLVNNVKATLNHHLSPVKRWHQGLAKREQIAVSVLAIVFVVFCLYWMVWAPIVAKHESAQQNYLAHQQIYEWIHEHEELIRNNRDGSTHQKPAQNSNRDVLTIVNNAASSSGIVLRSFSPEGNNKLRLQLEQQQFTLVMQWLYELEQNYGIEVGNIDISAGNAPSTVNVRATLQRDN